MSTLQEIGDLKSKFGKKYANNPMRETIYEGCYETKMSVAKSEQTILADTHWRKCYAILEEYQELLRKNGYKVGWHNNLKKYVLEDQRGNMVEACCYDASLKTKHFVEKYEDPCDALANLHHMIECANARYAEQYRGKAKGDHGEAYVDQTLELFHGKYKYAKNIKLAHEDYKGKTSETDLYVATSKGILVCEIKNKGNEHCQYKISGDGQWAKYDEKDHFIGVEKSPFQQNTRHCIATEMLLKSKGINDFKIIPVVIIGNEKARISANDSGNAVIQASELYNYIERLDYPEKYDEEYQQQIIDLLYANHIKEESYFELNVVDERMHKLTMEYAAYYLQMMRDIKKLCKDIREKENELVEQKIAEAQAYDIKMKIIRVVAIAFIDVIGVIMCMVMNELGSFLFCLLAVGLGFVGVCGTLFLFFTLGESSWSRGVIEDDILFEGEY